MNNGMVPNQQMGNGNFLVQRQPMLANYIIPEQSLEVSNSKYSKHNSNQLEDTKQDKANHIESGNSIENSAGENK